MQCWDHAIEYLHEWTLPSNSSCTCGLATLKWLLLLLFVSSIVDLESCDWISFRLINSALFNFHWRGPMKKLNNTRMFHGHFLKYFRRYWSNNSCVCPWLYPTIELTLSKDGVFPLDKSLLHLSLGRGELEWERLLWTITCSEFREKGPNICL